MQLYRFSPIETKEKLVEAILYVHEETTKLFTHITGETAPISSLTIFSHYPEEFEKLKEIQKAMGNFVGETLGQGATILVGHVAQRPVRRSRARARRTPLGVADAALERCDEPGEIAGRVEQHAVVDRIDRGDFTPGARQEACSPGCQWLPSNSTILHLDLRMGTT